MHIEFVPREDAAPHQQLVDQLLQVGAILSQIVEHMLTFQASGRSAPDADPIPEVVARLLDGVLEPLAGKNEDRVRIAADVVAQAHRQIADEIFLVPETPQRTATANPRSVGRRPV